MNIGDVVALVQEVEGVVTKVPALVTKVYEDAHGQVVADLHQLETTIKSVVSSDDNPAEALPAAGPTVTSDLTPPAPATTAAPDAAVDAAEAAFANLSAADKAAFLAIVEKNTGDGSPS